MPTLPELIKKPAQQYPGALFIMVDGNIAFITSFHDAALSAIQPLPL